jgi:hypothetical protein
MRGRRWLMPAVAAGFLMAWLALMSQVPAPWASDAGARIEAAREAGRPPPVDACLDLTLWPALLVTGCLALALAACARWWWPRETGGPAGLRAAGVPGRLTVVLLLAAVVLAAVPRVPRLAHSFWNDEETTMQDYAWGQWKERAKDGSWRFRPTPWQDTLFYNRGGSNHLANSVLTRGTLAVADRLDGAPDGSFSEAAARVLPFLASLGSVFLLGWILARAGLPRAGVVAALVLALHPWHLRYSVEIRGYSVMLLAMLGALAFMAAALAGGRRRDWAGFAACEALVLLCFPGALYFALALNGVAGLALLCWRGLQPQPRWRLLVRLAAWNLVAAIPVILWLAPSLPQFAYYLDEGKRMIRFGEGWGWERDLLTHLTSGLGPRDPAPGLHRGLYFDHLAGAAQWVLIAGLPLAALAGLVLVAWRGGARARLVVAVLVLGPVLSYAHNRLADTPTMPWYLLFAVFPLATGLAAWAELPRTAGRNVAVIGTAAAALLLFALLWWRPLQVLATVPRQPLRETAAVLRGTAPTYGERGDTQALTATFGTSAKRLRSYDPRVATLVNPEQLAELVARARAEGRVLRVAFCGRQLAVSRPERPHDRDLVGAVEDPESGFRRIGDLRGMEELFSYHVFELDPAGG